MQGREKVPSFAHSSGGNEAHSPGLNKKATSALAPSRWNWRVTVTQLRVRYGLDHWVYNAWTFVITVYALFADDTRVAATTLPADSVFFTLACIVMFCFALDLVLASLVRDDYWLGFYFWLDLLATVSMISDIGWAWEALLGTDQTGVNSGATKSTQIARAARASRAGTQAGRIIRLVRIIRLIRLVKLYKLAQERTFRSHGEDNTTLYRSFVTYRGANDSIMLNASPGPAMSANSEGDNTLSQSVELDPLADALQQSTERFSGTALIGSTRTSSMFEYGRLSAPRLAVVSEESAPAETAGVQAVPEIQPLEQSHVGQRLSDITTKRLILLILGLMFVLPLFYTNMYVEDNTSYTYALTVLDHTSETAEFDTVWNNLLAQQDSNFTPIIFLEVLGRKIWQTWQAPD